MDIYSEKLPLLQSIPGRGDAGGAPASFLKSITTDLSIRPKLDTAPALPSEPLGLGSVMPKAQQARTNGETPAAGKDSSRLLPPSKTTSLPLMDRLAARDRAYGLLSSLTKLGSGWDYSDAWFALARAYQESNQPAKAKDVLWWCVELEDSTGVRDWRCLGAGGYVL